MLMKTLSQSLTEQLAGRFSQRIRDRLLAPGSRLPSVRECARQQGVSPSTVVAAYDQLLAQGLVEARKNRGFFVREAVASRSEPPSRGATKSSGASSAPADMPRASPPLNATTLIRGMFHKVSQKPQPGMGVFPPDWLESSFMPAAVRRVVTTHSLNETSLSYGVPMGDEGLRRLLAQKLAAISVPAAPAQILTTVGATHALDIVSRTLLRPGDPVMVEEPGWAVEFARLAALGMRVLAVPRGPEGPDLSAVARLAADRPDVPQFVMVPDAAADRVPLGRSVHRARTVTGVVHEALASVGLTGTGQTRASLRAAAASHSG